MVFVAVLWGYMLVGDTAEDPPENALSVMTYNIWDLRNRRPEIKEVIEVIRSRSVPDLVLLQEVRGEKMTRELSMVLGLPHHHYFGFKEKGFGVAILSRYSLTKPECLQFKTGKKRYGALRCMIKVKGRNVLACSLHLERINSVRVGKEGVDISWKDALYMLTHEIMDDTVRGQTVDELLEWMGSEAPERVIIGGDFNTVLCSKAIRKMDRVFADVLRGSPDYFTGTYLKSTLPVAPRLDFLFHSSDMKCLGASIIKKSAGDHYPVRALFDVS